MYFFLRTKIPHTIGDNSKSFKTQRKLQLNSSQRTERFEIQSRTKKSFAEFVFVFATTAVRVYER